MIWDPHERVGMLLHCVFKVLKKFNGSQCDESCHVQGSWWTRSCRCTSWTPSSATSSSHSAQVGHFFPPAQFRISIRSGFYQQMVITRIVRYSVAEPKLFDLAPAPAPTFKKFPLRLRLELLWVPVFIAFKWKSRFFMTFWKEYRLISFFWSYSLWIMMKYTTLVWPGAGASSWSRNLSIPAPAKSSGSLRLRLHNTG